MHDLGLPGVTFEPEQKRVYPLGYTAAHLVGFADTGGEGLAGAEAALNDDIRDAAASREPVPLSIDLRVQAAARGRALQGRRPSSTPKGAVGIVVNVHTGEILGSGQLPRPSIQPAGQVDAWTRASTAAAGAVYEMGSTFKGFTVAAGLDSGVATPNSTFDAPTPSSSATQTIHDYHTTRHDPDAGGGVHSTPRTSARRSWREDRAASGCSDYFDSFGLSRPRQVELIESARPLTPQVWNEDASPRPPSATASTSAPLALARAYSVPAQRRRSPAR